MKLVYTLLGLLLMSAVQANTMTTIQLRNRPAAEVIPIVKPMLADDERISGHGFKIFLRSSAATVAQVKEIIAALDIAAKTLQISVFQGDSRGISRLGMGARLQIDGSDGSADIGSGGSGNTTGGGNITFSSGNGSGSIGGSSTRMRLQDNPIHQVRVTEGNAAYIETGAQIPYFSGAWVTPDAAAGGIEYKAVTTGFYVLPQVRGDNVTLQVSPFKNSLGNSSGGDIRTQSASTTISGRIGEWLLIGGVTEELRRAQSGIGSRETTQSRTNSSIWIKADLVR